MASKCQIELGQLGDVSYWILELGHMSFKKVELGAFLNPDEYTVFEITQNISSKFPPIFVQL